MLTEAEQRVYLARIERALKLSAETARTLLRGSFRITDRGDRRVSTEVDRCLSNVLRATLPKPGEGWLSEEDHDDKQRLRCSVVWIVDPLDGTREFVDGIPEWCISLGLVVEGNAVAGGICNPATNELFLGALNCGVTYNAVPVRARRVSSLIGADVLASRQECDRGEWKCFESAQFTVRQIGSVAYKLALVAAGLADATWTLSPKSEWDVAGGVALVKSSGGHVGGIPNTDMKFNREVTLLSGLVACANGLWPEIARTIDRAGTAVTMQHRLAPAARTSA